MGGVDVMADDRDARIAQLEAENAELRERETVLVGQVEQRDRALSEGLEQQTATAEVLRVIASSPTDPTTVLQAIVESAASLCQVDSGGIFRVDGDTLLWMANLERQPAGPLSLGQRVPLADYNLSGRAVLRKQTTHIHDIEAVIDREYPEFAEGFRQGLARRGADAYRPRTSLCVPLMRDDVAIGSLNVSRGEVRPFTEAEIALLQTFADQAVIAIENARLFEELQEANRQLGEASQHKSAFLANMSHELRTPLNAIIGYSEMLQEEAEDLEQETLIPDLQKVNGAGKHLLGLINDILDLSKIEPGGWTCSWRRSAWVSWSRTFRPSSSR